MLTVKNGTAATVIARASDDGDDIIFRVRKSELVNKAKTSSTGASQGVMLKLNHDFEYTIEGTPSVVNVKAGRGGIGTWFSMVPYPLAEQQPAS